MDFEKFPPCDREFSTSFHNYDRLFVDPFALSVDDSIEPLGNYRFLGFRNGLVPAPVCTFFPFWSEKRFRLVRET